MDEDLNLSTLEALRAIEIADFDADDSGADVVHVIDEVA